MLLFTIKIHRKLFLKVITTYYTVFDLFKLTILEKNCMLF